MSAFKKLIILICILGLFMVLLLVDIIISKTYCFSLVSATPERGVADGSTEVEIVVKLEHNGKKVANHIIYIITDKGRIGRKITDKEGLVIINYRCYLANDYNKLEDIDIKFYDENNSIFIYYPSTFVYTLKMDAPNSDGSDMIVDDIFYD